MHPHLDEVCPQGLIGQDIGLRMGGEGGFPEGSNSVMVSTAGESAWKPLDALNDSSDLANAVADATQDYAQSNTDPVWA
jgi:hypothetical protein